MPRVWRRRSGLDTPRPAGRRWARLRRSGSRATQVLIARVSRRRMPPGAGVPAGTILGEGADPDPRRRSWRRPARRPALPPAHYPPARDTHPAIGAQPAHWDHPATAARPVTPVSPVSPALAPSSGALPRDRSSGRGPVAIPLLPGPRTPARRARFAIVNGCTIVSLLLGMAAILLAIQGEHVAAALALLGCVGCDGCDGALARRLGVASPFGAQLDSLVDLGSFGIATGIVMHQWLLAGGANPVAAAAACALIAVCAAVRLARFNVSPRDGRYFSGVPTTMAAAVLALNIVIGPTVPAAVAVLAVVVYAVAMVTSFPHAKLGRVLRLPLWLWVVPAIMAMISVSAAFAATALAYLVSGPLVWLMHRRRPVPVTG